MAKYYSHTGRETPSRGEFISAHADDHEEGHGPAAYMSISHRSAKELSNFADRRPDETPFYGHFNNVASSLGLSYDYLMENIRPKLDSPQFSNLLFNAKDNSVKHQNNKRELEIYSKPEYKERYPESLGQQLKSNVRSSGIDYAKSISALKKHVDPHMPTELFTHIPEETVVVEAFADPKMKATIPIMGAYAMQKYGNLTASSDLSKHSSRLVKHAQDLGFNVNTSDDNPDAEVTNSLTFKPLTSARVYEMVSDSDITKRLSPETIKGAKDYYRATRQRAKQHPALSTSQFQEDHPKLPGMEG